MNLNLLNQPFEARIFRPAWGQEWFEGTLTIGSFNLRFDCPQGTLEIPHHRLVGAVHEGENPGDDERLILTDTAEPGLEIVTTDLDVLDCKIVPMQHAYQAWSERMSRREVRRRWKILGWCVVVCVGLTMVGSIALSLMVRALAARVPAEWDTKFGANVLKEMADDEVFIRDTNAVARIAALADPLLRVLPPTTNVYRFHFVRSEDPNAFALPGGHIVITTGMLELADSEELLGVLAHEMAHVTQRHVYRQIISTAGPLMICRLFLGRGGAVGTLIGGGAGLLISAGFSQEYEAEADKVGWNYLIAANVNPRGMIRMFGKLKEHEDKQGVAAAIPQAFQTHPATGKRIRVLEKQWTKLRRQSGFIELPAVPKVQAEAVVGESTGSEPAKFFLLRDVK